MTDITDSVGTDPLVLQRRARFRLLFIAVGLLLVGSAGYAGFVNFVQTEYSRGASAFALASLTGFAAFFSPCSFPLLLTFLARRSEESTRASVATAVRVALGATATFAVLGLLMAILGASIATFVQFDQPLGRGFRVGVGLIVVLLGLKQSRLINFDIKWMNRLARWSSSSFDPKRANSRRRGDFLYGSGFLLAGFG